MEELKKLLLLTVGAASVSLDKVDETIADLIEKGRLTVQQGKELREELTHKDDKETPLTRKDLEELLGELNLVTKREFEALEERLHRLEERD